jgi:hypothetical protein
MELQGNRAIKRLRARVCEIDHRHAIEPGHVTVSLYLQEILVPLILPNNQLIFRRSPNDPLASIAINLARVLADAAVNLELQPLRNVRRSRLEPYVEKHSGIPGALALESQREVKILVCLLGLQVAVLLAECLPVNRSVLDGPFFVADGLPTRIEIPVSST